MGSMRVLHLSRVIRILSVIFGLVTIALGSFLVPKITRFECGTYPVSDQAEGKENEIVEKYKPRIQKRMEESEQQRREELLREADELIAKLKNALKESWKQSDQSRVQLTRQKDVNERLIRNLSDINEEKSKLRDELKKRDLRIEALMDRITELETNKEEKKKENVIDRLEEWEDQESKHSDLSDIAIEEESEVGTPKTPSAVASESDGRKYESDSEEKRDTMVYDDRAYPMHTPILGEQVIIDRKMELLKLITIVIRATFRGYFGEKKYNHCGYFVDREMSPAIHRFAYWIDYPAGHHRFHGHMKLVRALAISEDGCHLYTGSRDKSIIIWDLSKDEKIRQWKAHEDWVVCLAYSSGILVSGSSDSTLRVWKAPQFALQCTLNGHQGEVICVSLSRGAQTILSGSEDCTIREWSAAGTGECLRVFRGHSDTLVSVDFIESDLISASKDRSMKVWNPLTQRDYRTVIEEDSTSELFGLSINCDCTLVASFSDGAVVVYSWPHFEFQIRIRMDAFRGCFHPLFPFLLAVIDYSEHTTRVFDVRDGRCIAAFAGHSDCINNVRFTPDGYRLISVSDDQTARVWDTRLIQTHLKHF